MGACNCLKIDNNTDIHLMDVERVKSISNQKS